MYEVPTRSTTARHLSGIYGMRAECSFSSGKYTMSKHSRQELSRLSLAVRVMGVHWPAQVMHLDLSDLQSVRAFARAFKEKHGGQLDVLVNNGESSLSPRC